MDIHLMILHQILMKSRITVSQIEGHTKRINLDLAQWKYKVFYDLLQKHPLFQ